MHRQGFDAAVTVDRFGRKIDSLLHTLIENGKGIELNVADLVPGGHDDPLLQPCPAWTSFAATASSAATLSQSAPTRTP